MVTGERRSGTTLVANFLNSQEGFAVHSDLLRSLFAEAGRLQITDATKQLSERERNILLSNLEAEGLETGMPFFSDIPRANCNRWIDVYLEGLKALSGDAEAAKKVVGTKVTGTYELLPAMLDAGVRVVFCIRDPRDVCLSAMNRFSGYHLFDFVTAWQRSVTVAKQLRGHANFHLVRFEDLVSEDRESELARLSQFLGQQLDGAARPTHRSGIGFTANSSFGDVLKPFDASAKDRWKRVDQTLPEVVFPSRFLATELQEFGYESPAGATHNYGRLAASYKQYILTRRLARTARSARRMLNQSVFRTRK
tara:strand:+ start:45486 stop:46412 length:927 start_codon:yes stop_codon:yes gene_type:complete